MYHEVSGLDPNVTQSASVTEFLTLPFVTCRAKPCQKYPIVNYAKLHILTSTAYEDAAVKVVMAREKSVREKNQK